MRVLLVNQVFYPDVVATAQHAHDLCRHLVQHGHDVTVIASRSLYGQRGAILPRREVAGGIDIRRIGRNWFGKTTNLARTIDFAWFYFLAAGKALTSRRPDVTICLTTPPFIALVGWLSKVLRGTKFVYWVMDLYPDLPVACGVMKPQSATTRFFELVNRFCLRRADRVVVLGRCMRDRVLAKGVDAAKVATISVWSDENEVQPIARRENPYAADWSLNGQFIVMYAGNFGLGHDVETMCRAAENLAGEQHIRFVFAGGGQRKPFVDEFLAKRTLQNCRLAGYQPRERLAALLSLADVHLATLREGIEGIMVPSKLFGIMAAGRAAIFIGNPKSELARVIVEHDCGLVVRPGDVQGLVSAIRELAADPLRRQQMGERGRAALTAIFSRQASCEAWRRLLEQVVEGNPASAVEQKQTIPQPAAAVHRS